MQAAGQEAVGDLGGAVITGIDGNPLAVLARQLQIPMHHIASDSNDDCPLFTQHGGLVDAHADAQVRVVTICLFTVPHLNVSQITFL